VDSRSCGDHLSKLNTSATAVLQGQITHSKCIRFKQNSLEETRE